MFSGIVDHIGVIDSVTHKQDTLELWVDSYFDDLTLGESIAVDGTCLTVASIRDNFFMSELSLETLNCTIAKNYKKRQSVNIERALTLSDRVGGHLVSGHVDTTGVVKEKKPQHEFIALTISIAEKDASAYLLKKGSITVNGVSLTINESNKESFTITLIPHSLVKTNLIDINVEDKVNIEYDLLAKHVRHQCKSL